jgi:hypothetical protein
MAPAAAAPDTEPGGGPGRLRLPAYTLRMTTKPPDAFTPADAARLIALEARLRRGLGRRLHEEVVQAAVAGTLRVDQLIATGAGFPHAAELRGILDGIRSASLAMVHELRNAADDRDYARLVEAWAHEVGLPLHLHSPRSGPWPDGVAAETVAWWTTVELLAGAAPDRARIRLLERRGATICVIVAHAPSGPQRPPAGFELCRMLGATVTLRATERRMVAAIRFPALR